MPGHAPSLLPAGHKRLPSKLRYHGPRVVKGPDGTRQWVVEGRPWSGVGWAGVGRGPVNCYTRAGLAEEPEPGVFRAADAKYRCQDMDRDGVDAELVNGPYEQISALSRTRSCGVASSRAVNDWARELYEELNGRFIMLLPLPSQTAGGGRRGAMRLPESGMPSGVIFDWVGRSRARIAPDVGAPLGGSRRDGPAGQSARQPERRVAPDRGRGHEREKEPRNQALHEGCQLPDGSDGRADECGLVFGGWAIAIPACALCSKRPGLAGARPCSWRFDREYDFGWPATLRLQTRCRRSPTSRPSSSGAG